MAARGKIAKNGAGRRLVLNVELEHERETGRWIADVVDIPGVMVYGESQLDAFRRVQALVFEVLADRLKHGEHPLTGHQSRPRPFSDISFARHRPRPFSDTSFARQGAVAR